ncbi:MAG: hypothetical protein Q9227_001993 [Pyrenula ochraceoflavens]
MSTAILNAISRGATARKPNGSSIYDLPESPPPSEPKTTSVTQQTPTANARELASSETPRRSSRLIGKPPTSADRTDNKPRLTHRAKDGQLNGRKAKPRGRPRTKKVADGSHGLVAAKAPEEHRPKRQKTDRTNTTECQSSNLLPQRRSSGENSTPAASPQLVGGNQSSAQPNPSMNAAQEAGRSSANGNRDASDASCVESTLEVAPGRNDSSQRAQDITWESATLDTAMNALDCGDNWKCVIEAAQKIQEIAFGNRVKTASTKALKKSLISLERICQDLVQARSSGSNNRIQQLRVQFDEAIAEVVSQTSNFKRNKENHLSTKSIQDAYCHIIPSSILALKGILVLAYQDGKFEAAILTGLVEFMDTTASVCLRAQEWRPSPTLEVGIKQNVRRAIKPRLEKLIGRYKDYLRAEQVGRAAANDLMHAQERRLRIEAEETRRLEQKRQMIAVYHQVADESIEKMLESGLPFLKHSRYRHYMLPSRRTEPDFDDLDDLLGERTSNREIATTPPPRTATGPITGGSPEIALRSPLSVRARNLSPRTRHPQRILSTGFSVERSWEDTEIEALLNGLQLYRGRSRYYDIAQHFGKRQGDPLVYRDMDDIKQQARLLKKFYLSNDTLQSRKEDREWLLSIED